MFMSELDIEGVNKVKNKEENKENNIYNDIYNIVFDVFIKIDNYDEIKKEYEEKKYNGNFDNIKKNITGSPYRNILFLEKNNIDVLSQIYNKIINWFNEEYKIIEDDIYVSLQLFNYNIPWINMLVYLRDKTKGEYITFSSFYYNRQINLKSFINIMQNSSGSTF